MKKVILCDLGGVLINLHWTQHAGTLLGKELTKPQLRQIWFDLISARHYEQGLTDFFPEPRTLRIRALPASMPASIRFSNG